VSAGGGKRGAVEGFGGDSWLRRPGAPLPRPSICSGRYTDRWASLRSPTPPHPSLVAAGITPVATLYHWDLPLALQVRRGLTQSDPVKLGRNRPWNRRYELCLRLAPPRPATHTNPREQLPLPHRPLHAIIPPPKTIRWRRTAG
jgi:hypothetical protein